MEENELKRKYEVLANLLISRISRYTIIAIFLLTITDIVSDRLNYIDISLKYLCFTSFITIILLFVPSIFFDVLNKHEKKYIMVSVSLISFAIGMFSVFSESKGILLISFPVILSTFFNDKKMTLYSAISTLISLFLFLNIKHFALIGSEESYVNMMQTSFIPLLLCLIAFTFLSYSITERFYNLIQQMLLYTNKLEQKQNDLNALIDNSNTLIDAQRTDDSSHILNAIEKIIKNLLHSSDVPFVIGINIDSKSDDWNIKSDGKYSLGRKEDHIHIGFCRKAYSFSYIKSKNQDESDLFIQDIDSVAFPFYDGDKLIGFAIFSIRMLPEARESLMTAHALIQKTLSNCILNNKIFITQEELVFNLAEVCEAKSEQTGQHVKRIAKYMEIFGEALELSPFETKVVSIASMLHDIGKLNIPISILDKPGKLTDEEYEIIKSHTKIGYDMLKNCSGIIMNYASQMALEHHERWDGRGYNKLKGEEISFYSRYVAVADVFDALTSKRSYKKAWSNEEVRDEIIRCRGTQFCPDAVDKFEENYEKFVAVRDSMPDEEEM